MQVPSSTLLAEYLRLSKDNSAANTAVGKTRMDYFYTFLLGQTGNYTLEKTKYGTTKSSQRSYLLPPDYIKMKTVRIHDGTQWHTLTEVPSMDQWNRLTEVSRLTSIPEFWTVINEQGNMHLEVDGVPSANGATGNLEIVFEGYQDPITFPSDYATGTVTIANGAATVNGGSTVFTASMVGRFLQVSGGKYFYDIKAFVNTNQITLVNYFQEGDVTNSAYVISECLRLPFEYSYTPLWGALELYFKPSNASKSKEFGEMYARDITLIEKKYQNKSKGAVTPGIQVRANKIDSAVPRNYPLSNLRRI